MTMAGTTISAATDASAAAISSSISNPRWSLTGRTIVVTGGTKGIGAAVVDEALRLNAALVIYCSRSPAMSTSSTPSSSSSISSSRTIHVTECDLSTAAGRAKLVAVCQVHRPIHGLVNNVGLNVRKSIIAQTEDEYQTIFRTNVDAAYHLTRDLFTTGCFFGSARGRDPTPGDVAPRRHNNNNASIVNVSSAAGVASTGTGVAYAMSKAAMNQMTKNLAMEWAVYGIRVNAVAPWMTMTPMLAQAVATAAATSIATSTMTTTTTTVTMSNDADAEDGTTRTSSGAVAAAATVASAAFPATSLSPLDHAAHYTPLRRLAAPREIAGPITFLLLEASSYITGQVLAVDGGLTAQGYPGPCVQSYYQ